MSPYLTPTNAAIAAVVLVIAHRSGLLGRARAILIPAPATSPSLATAARPSSPTQLEDLALVLHDLLTVEARKQAAREMIAGSLANARGSTVLHGTSSAPSQAPNAPAVPDPKS